MLAGQGGHVLIDIRPHHREAFSTMGKCNMRLMRRKSARPWRRRLRFATTEAFLQRFGLASLHELTAASLSWGQRSLFLTFRSPESSGSKWGRVTISGAHSGREDPESSSAVRDGVALHVYRASQGC